MHDVILVKTFDQFRPKLLKARFALSFVHHFAIKMRSKSKLKIVKVKSKRQCCYDGANCICHQFPHRSSKKLTDMALLNPHMSFYKNPWWTRLRCESCHKFVSGRSIYNAIASRHPKLHDEIMKEVKNLTDLDSSYKLKDVQFACPKCGYGFAAFDINFYPASMWTGIDGKPIPGTAFGYSIQYITLGYTNIDLTIVCESYCAGGFSYIGMLHYLYT